MTQQRPEAGTVPGLPNLHSHAFQRAMAGLTERRGAESDSFWTWREQMYRFVEPLSPGRLRRKAGVAGKPAPAAQRRFLNDRDSYARIMETKVPGGRIGIAPHSLRAVTLGDLTWAAATWRGQPAHIHVSEQTREVEDCLAAHGRRPIDLLLDTVEVDDHWCLVHATHADKAERARIAKAQAASLPDCRPLPSVMAVIRCSLANVLRRFCQTAPHPRPLNTLSGITSEACQAR